MSLDERNREASDPRASVWVTANAGSGKTYLLVDRAIRLLLSGTPPARILCLTFTKAAASEMSRRLFDRLSGWIAMDDEALRKAIAKMVGDGEYEIANARRLFAQALETPGGLKIQTIHAFCERLLQRFPLEAGVVPGFSVLDDQAAAELLARCRASVLDMASTGAVPALSEALNVVVARAGAEAFDSLLDELLKAKNDVAALPMGEELFRLLSDALELSENETAETIRQRWLEARDREAWRALARLMLGASAKTDNEFGVHAEILARASSVSDAYAAAGGFFLKRDGECRANLLTKNLARDNPAMAQFAAAEWQAYETTIAANHSVVCRSGTYALLTLAQEILARFADEKRSLGLYGYDDLIERARALLTHAAGDWVLYKLDGGLDHVLIDEAQDTSPEQWDVIARLTAEFFSGEGARGGLVRTIFVVGDDKQSIYSFQGADPARFGEMKTAFAHAVQAAGQTFRNVPLEVSFRSSAPVLQAVDRVWNRDARPVVAHQANRFGQHGLVELWPPVFAEEANKRDAWSAPGIAEMKSASHPRLRLSRRIAEMIRYWLDSGEKLASRGRPIVPGDILILLRKRGAGRNSFMDALVGALKQAGLPVAGSDRLKLAGHIGVLDLMALARFVLNTADDLSLAAILKSPLFEKPDGSPYSETELMDAAIGRGDRSLWQSLRSMPALAPVARQLESWLALAAESPFNFFSRVLMADGAYGRFLRRLGSEAAEPLDAFMAKAMDFEANHAPSLGRFIAWLDDGAAEIKRDMDMGGGEIRVMTVHGSKGLEANIVILPDTCDPAVNAGKVPRIYFHAHSRRRLPIWRMPAAKRAPLPDQLYRAHVQRMEEEYARLLYVAMTRACDRLYIAGAASSKDEVKAGTWYDVASQALSSMMSAQTDWQGRPVLRLQNEQIEAAFDKPAEVGAVVLRRKPPDWARVEPPAERARIWLPPSKIGAEPDEQASSPAAAGAQHRYKRGNIIHTLLQYLPDLPVEAREAACHRYLSRKGLALSPADAGQMAAEVLGILDHEDFAAVFAPGSLAEVPLAAFMGDGTGLSGRVDRLAVTDAEVLITDYKTNRPPPLSLADVPAQYRAQMDAYRQALQPLFPEKKIRTALIWTDGPRFMELPPASA